MSIFLRLYLIAIRFVIATNSDVRNPQLKCISRPVLKHRGLFRSLVTDSKIRKENARRVSCDKYEHMPQAVQVRKVDVRPRLAEQSVVYPTSHGKQPHQRTSNAQTVHATALDTLQLDDQHKHRRQT